MRERLLVAFVSLALGVVGILLVERAYTTSELIHSLEQRKVERSAAIIAGLVAQAEGEVTPALLRSVLFPAEHVVYVDARGDRVTASRHPAHDHAADGDGEDLTATRGVAGGGTVTVRRHVSVVDARVADALVPLVLVSLALVLAAALTAVWLARRLARPFDALAGIAARIGRGDFAVDVPRSRVPEADQIALALRTSARDLDALVRREREFGAHASHDLRTPITAARLQLEELALSTDPAEEAHARVAAAVAQLDRLSDSVDQLLDASRNSRVGAQPEIDLAAAARAAVVRWQPRALERRIEVHADSVVPVRVPVGAVVQLLDVLVGNAVTHGEGGLVVAVSEHEEYVELRVGDEGPRTAVASVVTGRPGAEGGGLRIATEIVESLGGRLRLTEDPTTTFSVLLPRPDRSGGTGAARDRRGAGEEAPLAGG